MEVDTVVLGSKFFKLIDIFCADLIQLVNGVSRVEWQDFFKICKAWRQRLAAIEESQIEAAMIYEGETDSRFVKVLNEQC